MLNGKFIATSDLLGIFTKDKVYEFVDGRAILDHGFDSCQYESLADFYDHNRSYTGRLVPYVEEPVRPNQPTRTVNITKTQGESVQMKFSYKDSEETVEYTVDGDGDLGDVMVMLREVTTFMTHLGFSEEVVLRKMKQYVEDSEI